MEDNFVIVTLNDKPYYDKTALFLMVAFCLVPFVLFTHLTWLPYIANNLEDLVEDCLSCLCICKCSCLKKKQKIGANSLNLGTF